MSTRSHAPQYRRYRQSYARVKINGVWHHLGRYDDPKAQAKYRELVTQWAAAVPADVPEQHELTIAEVLADYLDHAAHYYGTHDPKSRYHHMVRVVREVRQLYEDLPAHDFGPKKLMVVRQAFVDRGCCRSQVNDYTRDVVAIFRWAVESEVLPGSVLHALQAVRPLQRGRTTAPEGKTVRPVEQATIDATLPHLTAVVADMVRLQLLTGCRPGELCSMTPGQVDRSGDVWLYRPVHHKTEHRDHDRVIAIGPKGQDVLRRYLLRPDDAPCFSPKESLAQHLDAQHEQRATPLSCGNKPKPGGREHALAKVGDQYDVASYRRAVERACDRAFPAPKGTKGKDLAQWRHNHRWTPHRLRHTAGTLAREKFGLDAAQAVLGHRHARVTEVYSELQTAKAVEVARRLG